MRLALVTRIPFRELVDMPPELLATVLRAQADMVRESRERAPAYDDDDDEQLVELDELDDEEDRSWLGT